MNSDITYNDIARWAEAIAALSRTSLAFSESAYERERHEEILHITADMLSAIDGDNTSPDEFVAGWLATAAKGVSGYVTPKIGVGAYVGNDSGELLLIQRSDNHRWMFPTGWADIGYSASEVVLKEVAEECGLDVQPEQLVSLYDGMRAGSPIPHYVLIFKCRLVGGELKAHPLECDDIGWFSEDNLPQPLMWGERWITQAFAALRNEISTPYFDPPRSPVWRTIPG